MRPPSGRRRARSGRTDYREAIPRRRYLRCAGPIGRDTRKRREREELSNFWLLTQVRQRCRSREPTRIQAENSSGGYYRGDLDRLTGVASSPLEVVDMKRRRDRPATHPVLAVPTLALRRKRRGGELSISPSASRSCIDGSRGGTGGEWRPAGWSKGVGRWRRRIGVPRAGGPSRSSRPRSIPITRRWRR